MIRQTTNRDIQRVTFVESLYTSLRKQAAQAMSDYKKFIIVANTYLEDGLEESECIGLLMIDGLAREAAESYVAMALSDEEMGDDGLDEYSFQVEDSYGKMWSSYDVGKTVRASSDDEAWEKAEELITAESESGQRILSVTRI